MRPLETTAMLAAFERRGPGTDAERRAARRLAQELFRAGHKVRTETFWCRPNWALAHAWHVALALAGSLLSVSQPTIGAAMLGAALLSTLADGLTGVSPGRRLTPERASQNVVATATATATATAPAHDPDDQTRLIITANYDAGRTALVYRDALRRPAARLRSTLGPLALGWIAWLSLAISWSLVIAVIRATEHHPPHALGAIQLPPTVVLVLSLALLLEAAAASYGPAANDNASGTAVAIALANALRAGPPRNLTVELVLQGAGEGQEIGLRTYLRAHKSQSAIVLGIAPCGDGHVRHWLSDGRLIPLRYARALRELASDVDGASESAYRGRGATPALPARARGLSAIAIGCLDPQGLPPRSHQPIDVATTIDQPALDRTIEFALRLVDEINASLAPADASARPA
jgi:Peptidase family M28